MTSQPYPRPPDTPVPSARRRARVGMSLPIAVTLRAAAALAALAVLIAAAWHPPVHADGGASARSQTAASAQDESGATMQAYTQRILHALSDDYTNNWVRYWKARADCDVAEARDAPAAPMDHVLFVLTAAICVHLDARLGVNPADYPPRGDERTGGLLLNEPGAALGYTLFPGLDRKNIYLLDPLGRIAHSWHIGTSFVHAKLIDNGNLLAIGWNDIFEFDSRGSVVWQYGIGRIHHDFLKMPNGNVLMLVRRLKTREQAITAGANPEFVHETGLEYDYLLEVRPTGASEGEGVWEWSPWDHLVQDFDPSKPNYGAIAEHPELIDINFLLETMSKRRPDNRNDWLHTNAIDYNPELDQIMLSPRHFSELWIIDHSADVDEARGHSGGNSGMGGDLLYRWGNPRAYGHGTTADQRLFWQHQTHWIPPGLPGAGNILAFNNGNEFAGNKRLYSSVDEIAPPVDGYGYRRDDNAAYPPVGLEWTYTATPPADFYAHIMSGTQRLPNGNTLVIDGPAGTIFQVTPDGKTVWKYRVPLHYHISLWRNAGAPPWLTYGTTDNPSAVIRNNVHRAHWYPPDYAGLQNLDLTPGARFEDRPDLFDWARASLIAGDFGERLAGSGFDIYLDANILIYFKQPCSDEDLQAKLFLHIFPADARDIPDDRQDHGFVYRSFEFGDSGKALDDWCIAIAPLPDYAIERIRTGQYSDAGAAWQTDVELGK